MTSPIRSGVAACLFLTTSAIAHPEICWGEELFTDVQVLSVSAPEGEFWFGFVPSATKRMWIALDDGRIVSGTLYPLPWQVRAFPKAFLVPVPRSPVAGALVAVGRSGRLVGSWHSSIGGDRPGPVAALDAYGNVIGYMHHHHGEAIFARVVWGIFPLPVPGRHAGTPEIRYLARHPLQRVRAQVQGWWESRPSPGDPKLDFARWWRAYPVKHLLHSPSRA